MIALLMGLVTSGLVYGYMSGLVDKPVEEKRVAVVVAGKTLQPKSVVGPGSVRLDDVPLASVHPDAIISLAEAEGRIVRDTIVAGEQVIRNRLYADGEQPGLTFAIPPGKRAVSVAVNEVIGVAGFIKPGDEVDVLATFDESLAGQNITVTVLQGIEVLAIAQETEADDDGAQVSTTVTLAVGLEEAERLTLAEEKGRLRLALRPAHFADEQFVQAVSSADILPGGRASGVFASSSPSLEEERPAPVQRAARTGSASGRTPSQAEFAVEVIRGTQRERVTLP